MSYEFRHLGIVSRIAPDVDDPLHLMEEIRSLVLKRASDMGITGFMLLSARHVVMLLEGTERDLRGPQSSILRETSLRAHRLLIEKQVNRRLFSRWPLPIDELSPSEFAQLTGVPRHVVMGAAKPFLGSEDMNKLVVSAYLSHELQQPPWADVRIITREHEEAAIAARIT
ncbi:MAG: BLUF domain-containing protein [Rhodospirillaceae bacterium]